MYQELVDKNIANAMKNGNQIELSVWRAIKTEFVKFKTSASGELTDEKELQIINKMAQQRKDSIEQFKNGGRLDLVDAEEKELNELLKLLPKEATEEDIEELIKEFKTNFDGVLTIKNMKDVCTNAKFYYVGPSSSTYSKYRDGYYAIKSLPEDYVDSLNDHMKQEGCVPRPEKEARE